PKARRYSKRDLRTLQAIQRLPRGHGLNRNGARYVIQCLKLLDEHGIPAPTAFATSTSSTYNSDRMSQAAEPKADAGLGALGREVADDAVRLVHAEIDLAKAQFKDAARRLIVAVVLIVAASVLLLIAGIEALG